MTREEFRDKKSKDYRKHREAYGINDPVYLDEIEEAYYQGMVDADSHPHWISVEDELPPKYDSYLTRSSGNVIEITHYNIDGWHTESKGKVTHWMHLPQPPSSSEKPNNSKKGGKE